LTADALLAFTADFSDAAIADDSLEEAAIADDCLDEAAKAEDCLDEAAKADDSLEDADKEVESLALADPLALVSENELDDAWALVSENELLSWKTSVSLTSGCDGSKWVAMPQYSSIINTTDADSITFVSCKPMDRAMSTSSAESTLNTVVTVKMSDSVRNVDFRLLAKFLTKSSKAASTFGLDASILSLSFSAAFASSTSLKSKST
jgi:hypothetical protein